MEPSLRAIPLIENAAFAPNGDALFVKLSMPCSSANLDEVFSCSMILNFPCANISTCQWTETNTIKVTPPVSDYCAKPEDMIVLLDKTENSLCMCFPANSCNGIEASLNQTVIQAPKVVLLPTVVFNLPAVLPSCSGLTLDLSNSFGNLGRSWIKVNVSVVTKCVCVSPQTPATGLRLL
jgi:hypothetical protein